MNILELKNFLKEAYNKGNQNVLIESSTGIGKSSVVKQVAESLGVPMIDLRSAYLERPDILGLPYLSNDKMVFANPEILEPIFTEPKGVLFFDELNRGDNAVLNCLMQICTDRRINNRDLAGNWLLVAAINPADDQYIGAAEIDKALLDRFIEVHLEFDKDCLFDYLYEKFKDSTLYDFLRTTYNYERCPMSPRKLETALSYNDSSNLRYVLDAVTYNKYQEWVKNVKPVKIEDFKANIKLAEENLKNLKAQKRHDVLSVTKDSLLKNINEVTVEMLDIVKKYIPIDSLYILFEAAMYNELIDADYIRKDMKLAEAFGKLIK